MYLLIPQHSCWKTELRNMSKEWDITEWWFQNFQKCPYFWVLVWRTWNSHKNVTPHDIRWLHMSPILYYESPSLKLWLKPFTNNKQQFPCLAGIAPARVRHGYTAGQEFQHHTCTRTHHTRDVCRSIPHRKKCSVVQNPHYHEYPRVHSPPSFL